jgi:hypothetical protein
MLAEGTDAKAFHNHQEIVVLDERGYEDDSRSFEIDIVGAKDDVRAHSYHSQGVPRTLPRAISRLHQRPRYRPTQNPKTPRSIQSGRG